ncbi:MAG: hypothetical protein Q7R95_02710 [bacterium]|nr:hypothetical protein [bacterium]
MKIYLGIKIPDEVKQSIDEQLESLKKDYPQFNWITKEQYHLNLHFFGDFDEVKTLKNQLEHLLFDQESFYLYGFNFQMFMDQKITIYMTFIREKRLEKIAEIIKNNFYIPGSKPGIFIPQLNVARTKIPSKQQYFVMQKKIAKLSIDISFPVKKLYIFESANINHGVEYKTLFTLPLYRS